MAPDDPTSSDASQSPDPFGVDFAAIVAEHNAESGGRQSSKRRRDRSGSDPDPTPDEPIDSGVDPTAEARDVGIAEADDGARTEERDDIESRSRFWKVGYPVSIGAALLVLVLLVWAGLGAILDSTDGQLRRRVEDPTAPGYEAALDKTPTALLLLTSPAGTLDSMVLVSLMSDTSSGMIVMPSGLMLTTTFGDGTAADWYSRGGAGSVAAGVGAMLQLGFNETIEIPSSQWPTIVGPYGSVSVTSPDPVRDASGAQVFAKGTVNLAPDQVATYLSSLGSKESELLRVSRQESFWTAFLGKVQANPSAFALQTTSGLGFYLVEAARGQVSIVDLPVASTATPAGSPQHYAVQVEAAQSTLAAVVPFPDGGGTRARFRVLDGTGRLDNGLSAAVVLAAAGGQIDVIGNANRFDIETTTFYFYDGTSEETARHFRDALGMGELQKNSASASAADIVVVLGADYADRGGAVGMAMSSSTTAAR